MGKLKLYIDENVDVRIAEGLRKRGVDIFYTVERGNVGISDEEHFKHAEKLQAVIFTHDHHREKGDGSIYCFHYNFSAHPTAS